MTSYSFIQSLICIILAGGYLPVQGGVNIRVCDRRVERIQCHTRNQVLYVRNAFYGRVNPFLCRFGNDGLDRTRCGTNNNVKAIVQKMCGGKNRCSLRADKRIFGGNCPDNSAYLVVDFQCIRATQGCRENQFRCLRYRKCIPNENVCDEKRDCPDGSDEADCDVKEQCGKQAIQPSFITQDCPTLSLMKIVGGCDARPYSWPWAIQLRNNMSIDGQFIHQCGAVLISPSFALTASHCFLFAPDASSWIAVAGHHEKNIRGKNDQVRQISRVIALPNPTENILDRDLTLIKFNRPMTLNNYVTPICLPPREPTVGDECAVVGWGETKGTGTSDVLKQTLMPIVDRKTCNNTEPIKGEITDYMICSGWEDGRNDACQGDSGGPLMCKIDGVYYVHGIVSWGEDCAKPNLPGVYVNVHKAVNWIRNQMAKN